jgi:GT2 family glycosyltransferase
MKLSVIIPAYNHLPDVMACLNSLRAFAQTGVEYLVQDDASPDYFGPAVIPPEIAACQRNAVNLGFGGNCNAGAARASGDVLMFINQDVYAVPDWSQGWDSAILSAFADRHIGIVGARLLFPDGGIQNAGGEIDGKCQPYHIGLGYSNPHHEEVSTPRPVSWTTGAALAIRRDLFEQASGFDPIYERGYFEDVDVCLKVRDLGFTVWYEPRCTLIHKVGQSGGNPHFMRNAYRFRERWANVIEPDCHLIKERFW